MPKKPYFSSNERVDLPDFARAASEYTADTEYFRNLRVLKGTKSRLLNGFRVLVEDQTANPGQITVYNGDAIDTSGRIVHNEDQENASISVTLAGASQTFYVELAYIESPSDADFRAFWDPTKDNADPIPDGGEVPINVATRLSPGWTIVTPVSTTGFEVTSNANSVRIPLCILRTDGSNVISNVTNTTLVQVSYSSVLEYDAALGANSIRVTDSRLFGDTGNITVDFGSTTPAPQLVAITANDRVNNILSINPVLLAAHSVGAIVRADGTGLFVKENTDPNSTALADAAPNHIVDRTLRMFQGDETRGSAMYSSKETFGGRDDLNVRVIKDYVDLMAAQIRELKFGSPRASVTSAAPPTSFSSSPRYYDRVGSVAGSRNAAISIGNGTTTFGDFNGNTDAVFTAAISACPTGGTIFVKAGTYTFASTVSIPKTVTILGEGAGAVIITGALTSLFSITNQSVNIDHVGFTVSPAVSGTVGTLRTRRCSFGSGSGLRATSSSFIVYATECDFTSANLTGTAVTNVMKGVFTDCVFNGGAATCTLQDMKFIGSTISSTGFFTLGTNTNRISFSDCNLIVTGANPLVSVGATTGTRLVFNNSTFTLTSNAGAGEMGAVVDVSGNNVAVSVTDCTFNVTASGTTSANLAFLFRFGTAGAVTGCSFSMKGSTSSTTFGEYCGVLKTNLSAINASITGCTFSSQNIVTDVTSGSNINVSNCTFKTGSGTATAGVEYFKSTCGSAISPLTQLSIQGCSFYGATTTSAVNKAVNSQDIILNLTGNRFTGFTSSSTAIQLVSVISAQAGVYPSITIAGNAVTGFTLTGPIFNCFAGAAGTVQIVDNSITNLTSASTAVIQAASGIRGTIQGNVISAVTTTGGLSVVSSAVAGVISGNQIYDVVSSGGSVYGIESTVASNITISDNSLRTLTSTSDTSAIRSSATSNCTIDNNRIDGLLGTTSISAIRFTSSISSSTIRGNVITNVGASGVGTATVIFDIGNSSITNLNISNNVVSATVTGLVGASNYILKTNSGFAASNLIISDNTFSMSGPAASPLDSLITVYNSNSCIVSGNVVASALGVTNIITVGGTANNVSVSGNTITTGILTISGVSTSAILCTGTTFSNLSIRKNSILAYSNATFVAISTTYSAAGSGLSIKENDINVGDASAAMTSATGILVSTTTSTTGIAVIGNSIVSGATSTTTMSAIEVTGATGSKNLGVTVNSNEIYWTTASGGASSVLGITITGAIFGTVNSNSIKMKGGVGFDEIKFLDSASFVVSGNIVGTSLDAGNINVAGLSDQFPASMSTLNKI